jgi:hypothetical protein
MSSLHRHRPGMLPRLGGLSVRGLSVSGLLAVLVGIAPVAAMPLGWPGARPYTSDHSIASAPVDDFAPDGYRPDDHRSNGYGQDGYRAGRYGSDRYRPDGNRLGYGMPGDPRLTAPSRAQLEAQAVQRCNIGRLVGGIVGGGVGYATSRKDGRSWAVPLGALLGQQIGCNAGNGRAPLPW